MLDNRGDKLRFLEVSDSDRENIESVWRILEPELGQLLDDFYDHLWQFDSLSALIGDAGKIPGLKRTQYNHWQFMFSGRFDDAYFQAAKRVGDAHQKIGLAPEWYLSAYSYVMSRMVGVLARQPDETPDGLAEKVATVSRILFLDMQEVIASYHRAVNDAAAAQQQKNADLFEKNVIGLIGELTDASSGLSEMAADMAGISAEARMQTESAVSATDEAASSVETVSESAEALTSSISAIGDQADQADQATSDAVIQAEQARSAVDQLTNTSSQIGSVVGMIKEVADQTNLLALNATIEAARAGEAGKGFAVVASEVKSLASQTKRATDEIADEIAAIQGSVTDTVASISAISSVIEKVDGISSAISDAVELQNAATTEINQATENAAAGADEISRVMNQVGTVASAAETKASEVADQSAEVGARARGMHQAIDGFLIYLRQG